MIATETKYSVGAVVYHSDGSDIVPFYITEVELRITESSCYVGYVGFSVWLCDGEPCELANSTVSEAALYSTPEECAAALVEELRSRNYDSLKNTLLTELTEYGITEAGND
jgi:hypothetical protein